MFNSYIEKIIDQGLQEGRQAARLEILQWHISLLISLLNTKFGYVSPHYSNLVSNANQEQICNWCIRVIKAETLQDVFSDTVSAKAMISRNN